MGFYNHIFLFCYNYWYNFDNNGYIKTGWIQDGGKWYYLNSRGIMAKNTIIDGYIINSDGVWSHIAQNSLLNSDKKISSSDNINFTIDKFVGVMKTKVGNVNVEDEPSFSDFLPDAKRKKITIDDEEIYAYIYSSNEGMEKAALSIYSDGEGYISTSDNGETIPIDTNWWYRSTHFYKKGNIIVQYVGRNQKTISYLKDIFGEQFAGDK